MAITVILLIMISFSIYKGVYTDLDKDITKWANIFLYTNVIFTIWIWYNIIKFIVMRL